MAKSKKEFGRIKLPKGTTANERAKGEPLDSSDIATILAALRMFQDAYRDCDAVVIADAWPMHFAVSGDRDDLNVSPEPLGSEDIDALCEKINCASTLTVAR